MPHRHGYDGPVAIRGATCNDAGQRQSTTRRRRGTAQRQPPPSSAVPHGVSVPHPGHGAVLASGRRGARAASGGRPGVAAAAVLRASVAAPVAVALASHPQPSPHRSPDPAGLFAIGISHVSTPFPTPHLLFRLLLF